MNWTSVEALATWAAALITGANWVAVEACGTWATALVALGGIFFVRKQLKQVERTIRGDVHERLTTESIEILKFLATNPESYSYFYEGKPLTNDDPNRVFVLYAAEITANYMEHVINQKGNHSKGRGKPCRMLA